MRVAQHKIRVAQHRPPLTLYDLRIDRIARLLRRAIQSGEKGLLESEVGNVRSCASTMIRAYDAALQSSLHLSLTKRHCASIDEKSHRIELLRPKLEKKIAGMNRQEQPSPSEYRPRAATDLLQPVEIFLGHCAEFRDAAGRMREMNAELMRRSDSNRSARLRASHPS